MNYTLLGRKDEADLRVWFAELFLTETNTVVDNVNDITYNMREEAAGCCEICFSMDIYYDVDYKDANLYISAAYTYADQSDADLTMESLTVS